jgi:peroxiredoxin
MPGLDALYRRYRHAGLEVVAINLDSLSAAGVQAFVRDVPVTFPIGLDPSWATAHTYRVFGVPTSYLIDRDGNVVVREVGPRDWTDTTSAAAVRRLLE